MREVEEALGGAPPCDSCNLTNGCILCCCCRHFWIAITPPCIWLLILLFVSRDIWGEYIHYSDVRFPAVLAFGRVAVACRQWCRVAGEPCGWKRGKKGEAMLSQKGLGHLGCIYSGVWVGFSWLLIDVNHFIPTSESLLFQHQGCVLFALLLKRTHIGKMWRQDVKIRTN